MLSNNLVNLLMLLILLTRMQPFTYYGILKEHIHRDYFMLLIVITTYEPTVMQIGVIVLIPENR